MRSYIVERSERGVQAWVDERGRERPLPPVETVDGEPVPFDFGSRSAESSHLAFAIAADYRGDVDAVDREDVETIMRRYVAGTPRSNGHMLITAHAMADAFGDELP